MINDKIMFRGKREDTKEWVEGCYLHTPETILSIARNIHYIVDEKGNYYMVYPYTVSQYTGLEDITGKKIFEGDIVRFRHGGTFHEDGIWFRNYQVEFVNTFATYGIRLRNRSIHFPFKQSTACMYNTVVIGNIYDNPELLEEGAKADA